MGLAVHVCGVHTLVRNPRSQSETSLTFCKIHMPISRVSNLYYLLVGTILICYLLFYYINPEFKCNDLLIFFFFLLTASHSKEYACGSVELSFTAIFSVGASASC